MTDRDESAAQLVTGICDACAADDHHMCVADSLNDGCICPCMGETVCPTCDKAVTLWAVDEPGIATGECCHWLWVDDWDGCKRFDLTPDAGAAAESHDG